ncbi:hypothetical protein Q4583_15265 [Neptunomonas phycophila]|nr:hypothetical protein [Neptunomonas phycophila]MDO6785479.1 hypothetical protein [Neptunomonas phycophila]
MPEYMIGAMSGLWRSTEFAQWENMDEVPVIYAGRFTFLQDSTRVYE